MYLQWSWSCIAIKRGFFIGIGLAILLNDINQHFGHYYQTRRFYERKDLGKLKSIYKKIFTFVALIGVVALGLSIINPVSAATVTPTITNLKATAAGQKVTFSFDWDLTGKSVKEGDTFTIDAPEGVNITEIATQSLQANGAEVATVSMTGKRLLLLSKKQSNQ